MKPRVSRIVPVLALALSLLAACDDDGLSGVVPKLVVDSATPRDPAQRAEYLVDFGDVRVGSRVSRVLVVRNAGRAPMRLDPLSLQPPFSSGLTEEHTVGAIDSLAIPLTFEPKVEGAAEATFTLQSDGGEATVRLAANALAQLLPPCDAAVTPDQLDFGNLIPGNEKTRVLLVENLGDFDCELAGVQLADDSNAAFSLHQPPAAGTVIAPGDGVEVAVTFAPTQLGTLFSGRVEVRLEPGEVVVDGLVRGSSTADCPNPLPDGTCPVATEPGYINTATALYTFDPKTGETRKVGDFHAPGVSASSWSMLDIAIDQSGVMFGVSNKKLWAIDSGNARCTEIGKLPKVNEAPDGLTVLPDGRLVIAGDSLDVIARESDRNQNVPLLQTLVTKNRGYTTSGDAVALPDGWIYWAVHRSSTANSTDLLVRVNGATGAVEELGDTGLSNLFGLGYSEGTLFGFSAKSENAYGINPLRPWETTTLPLSAKDSWWGATTNPTQW